MRKCADITGQRFGRLVAIKRVERPNTNLSYWLCKCDCGKEKEIFLGSLKRGYTTSCGCYHSEVFKENVRKSNKKYNEYEVVGDTVYVTMKYSQTMICDVDDWERLKDVCWSKDKNGYAIGTPKGEKNIKFHIAVMGKREGMFIDHINRNRLDNRKCNLRFVTPKENTWNIGVGKNNKSGVVGVYKRQNKWVASIGINRKTYHIGIYNNFEDAVKARKEAEKLYQPLPERLKKED